AAPAGHEVPAKLREIVVRGLAAEPAQRWPSMRALLDALRGAVEPQRSRSLWPIAVIAVLVSAVIALVVVQLRPTPDAAIPSAVESLAANARLWASRAHWVYPDATAAEETALRAVAALRGLDGELDAPGDTQADVLASEFAGTLARLGDQYWAAEGGRVFARDFYAQALLFDPTRSDARERCGFTPAELAELRQRAEAGDFSQAELEAADELVELATPMLEAKDDAPPPEQIVERVAKVKKRAAKRKAERSHVASSEAPPVVAIAPTPKPVAPVVEPTIVPPPAPLEPAPVETDEPEEPKDPNAAREEAKKLVADARKLKQQGKRDAALKKMFEATKVDRRFAPAWDGLRDLHFQIGAYQEAVQYGEKAVKLSPSNGQYHLRLGEAHWKLKDYASAEKEWTKAAALGVAQAKERLATLPGR
ncbi:MAG TPA: hypothetical protein VG755_33050, partial [Nannocystaceae bacterium]|nr:hypothetical protein [Nannocystaceae bacterium]